MKQLIIIYCVFMMAILAGAQTATRSDDHTFLVRLPPSVDTTGLSIDYFMTGPFGGCGNYVRTKPNVHEYAIDASHEGKPARTLKAIIYCPGYGIALIRASSLADPAARNATVELKPLPSVRLPGRVVMPEGRGKTSFKIEVMYMASWSHKFFGIADGPVTQFKIASADVQPDGSFEMWVPDLARDPVVNEVRELETKAHAGREPRTGNRSHSETGELMLIVREPRTGNRPYELERAENPGRWAEIGIDEEFPNGLVLHAKPHTR